MNQLDIVLFQETFNRGERKTRTHETVFRNVYFSFASQFLYCLLLQRNLFRIKLNLNCHKICLLNIFHKRTVNFNL